MLTNAFSRHVWPACVVGLSCPTLRRPHSPLQSGGQERMKAHPINIATSELVTEPQSCSLVRNPETRNRPQGTYYYQAKTPRPISTTPTIGPVDLNRQTLPNLQCFTPRDDSTCTIAFNWTSELHDQRRRSKNRH